MIILYTDFGTTDPYVGQMHAVLARDAQGVPVIDLLHTAPDFGVRESAYLLAALVSRFPSPAIFVGVVDPGVGGERRPVIVHTDQHWFVGPDNGLFHIVARRATAAQARVIEWRPQNIAISFHGRDLFAPVAARLARGEQPPSTVTELTTPPGEWPDDLPVVIYIDHYGNLFTGLRAANISRDAVIKIGGISIRYAPVFSAVPEGSPFWYENSIGLVEIAVNRGSAAKALGVQVQALVSIS